jgi:hypothetical protein
MTTMARVGFAAYVTLAMLALAVAAMTLPAGGLDENPVATALLLVLAAWVGSRSIRVRKLQIEVTAGDAFMFCGLVVVGPIAALLIALSGTIGAVVGNRRQVKTVQAVFNLATVGLAAALAAHAYAGFASLSKDSLMLSGAGLIAAAVVFGLVNTGLVAMVIRLRNATKEYVAIWRGFGPWALTSTLASLLIGLGLVTMIETIGAAGPLVGLAGTAVVGASIETFCDRAENRPPSPAPSSSL